MRDTPPDQRFALSQRVVLREFSSRGDAEVVRELLLANGIEAFVISDDCGAVDPALSLREVFGCSSRPTIWRLRSRPSQWRSRPLVTTTKKYPRQRVNSPW